MNIVYTYLMESLRVFPAPWLPNAGAHLPPEAGAERTLEAVRCSAWLDAQVPQAQRLLMSRGRLRHQSLPFQELEAQRTHGGQLPLKLPLGFRRGKRLKQVW
jgi:hypothetical protein